MPGWSALWLSAGIQAAAAQPFPAADTLTPQQVQGRNLFNQSCMVCHVKGAQQAFRVISYSFRFLRQRHS